MLIATLPHYWDKATAHIQTADRYIASEGSEGSVYNKTKKLSIAYIHLTYCLPGILILRGIFWVNLLKNRESAVIDWRACRTENMSVSFRLAATLPLNIRRAYQPSIAARTVVHADSNVTSWGLLKQKDPSWLRPFWWTSIFQNILSI